MDNGLFCSIRRVRAVRHAFDMSRVNVFDLLFGSHRSFASRSLFTTVEVGIRYCLFAGIAWLLAYVVFRNRWLHRKIIARFPGAEDVRRELGYSLLTLVVFEIGRAHV